MITDKMQPEISIITPVFNRASEVIDSIRSSLQFVQESGRKGEIIVVDDASTDDSFNIVSCVFKNEISNNLVKMIRLPVNLGVTGAKQAGAELSRGEWLIFMDSDDAFLPGMALMACSNLAATAPTCPVVFFRCARKADGILIGPVQDHVLELDLASYLSQGTPGECLPVIRRECLLQVPYAADLRGFEGLTYAGLIQRFGPAKVLPIILRSYCMDENGGRLSTRKAIRQRGCLIAKGYLRMVLQFGLQLRLRLLSISLRIFYHGFNCLLYSASQKFRHNR